MTLLTEALRRLAVMADDADGMIAPAAGRIRTFIAPIAKRSSANAAGVVIDPAGVESVATTDRPLSGGVLVFVSVERGTTGNCDHGLIDEFARTLATTPSDAILILDACPRGLHQRAVANPGEPPNQLSVAPLIRRWQRLDEMMEPASQQADGSQVVRGQLPLERLQHSPIELLALLAECRSRFSWTLIDAGNSAPSRLSLIADLARRCDALYVVLERRRTGRTEARRFLHALRRAGIVVAACLLVDGRRTVRRVA